MLDHLTVRLEKERYYESGREAITSGITVQNGEFDQLTIELICQTLYIYLRLRSHRGIESYSVWFYLQEIETAGGEVVR
ncbi:hypothetical protein Nepgr_009855 [Nepenthes gracilis]|uniref:Uncharacterized protein n=1 Tax=Nepenthes gracilis TaxID=150966 RepID=A0AAD3SB76_NEPGR|nr:hypothetical protein Nepgr_009855 [Nepenthes gracilis]